MSNLKRPIDDIDNQDPDYQDGQTQERKRQRFIEVTAQAQMRERMRAIVQRELAVELEAREREAGLIQDRLHQVREILHALRLAVVAQYYRKVSGHQVKTVPTTEAESTKVLKECIKQQQPLHPAVRKLLGKKAQLPKFDEWGLRPKRKKGHETTSTVTESTSTSSTSFESTSFGSTPTASTSTTSTSFASSALSTSFALTSSLFASTSVTSAPAASTSFTLTSRSSTSATSVSATSTSTIAAASVAAADVGAEDDLRSESQDEAALSKGNAEETSARLPCYVPHRGALITPPRVIAGSGRAVKYKVKKRLVIGNISKWLPPDMREDESTHKWMVYVRGPRQAPNISDFVSRVRFILHPSYRPHDVVDITSSPFHLSRRGWGEFPVRVQVHFSVEDNRPVELIHPLKLDRTYTGLQTLGAETVVDVWLLAVPNESKPKEGQSAGEPESSAAEDKAPKEACRTLFSDGEHMTVAHDASETLLPLKVKEEPVDVEDSKGSLQQPLSDPATHFMNDHDYFGPSCTPQSSPAHSRSSTPLPSLEEPCPQTPPLVLKGQKGRLGADERLRPPEDLLRNGQIKSILTPVKIKQEPGLEHPVLLPFSNGANLIKSMRTSVVRCVDQNGKVMLVTLKNPKATSALLKVNKGAAAAAESEMKPFSLLKPSRSSQGMLKPFSMTNGILPPKKQVFVNSSTAGRSLLKKNCIQAPAAPFKEDVPPSPGASPKPQPVFAGRTVVVGKLHAKHNAELLPEAPKEDPTKEVEKAVEALKDRPEEALTWLLRQLPLVDKRADFDRDFRRVHYYCTRDVRQFLSWPLAKQRAFEWLRARAAQRILQNVGIATGDWSTRHIVQWGRMHGLTPLPPASVSGHSSISSETGGCGGAVAESTVRPAGKGLRIPVAPAEPTISEPSEIMDWLDQNTDVHSAASQDMDEDVDVVSQSPPPTRRKTEPGLTKTSSSTGDQLLCIPPDAALCGFVRDTASCLGIHLEREELAQGVLYPAAERLVLRGMLSFCEDLLRRSLSQAWKRSAKQPEQITPGDVREALLNRPEFSLFTNWGLGVEPFTEEDC